MSSKGSWGFISCSAMSATTAAAAAAASGGGCGGEGGAFTGVVDSGVSNASSESELLVKIKWETSEQSEDSCLQVILGNAGLSELMAQTSAIRLPLHFPEEILHCSMVSRAGYHGYGLLHIKVFMSLKTSLCYKSEHTLRNKSILQSLLSSVRVAQPHSQHHWHPCVSF